MNYFRSLLERWWEEDREEGEIAEGVGFRRTSFLLVEVQEERVIVRSFRGED